MKRIISILLTAVLLFSVFSVTVSATENKPEPSTGPADGVSMYGGARCGIYKPNTEQNKYVVNFDYYQGEIAVYNDEIDGMTYDKESNTLTVKDVLQPDNELFIWYMGNDFKLKVEGECEFGIIYVYNYFNFYNTTLNIIGSGTLTVNEKKANENAIRIFANGNDPLMGMDIADSVTVHLYSGTPEGGEDPAPVVTVNYSSITPAQGGAITVGGKTLPEAENEQVVLTDTDYVPVIDIENRDKDYHRGLQAKSKSDPDGTYSVYIEDGVVYYVSRWIYLDALNVWVIDKSFSSKRYKKADFEAEFDYVYGMAPASIGYIDSYRFNRLGTEGLQMTKDGEEGAVYIGIPTNAIWDWYWDHDYSGNYEIHRVLWDDKLAYYVEDTSFKSIDLVAAELEENGFHVVKEAYDERLELNVWDAEPESDERYMIDGDVMSYESDPDGLYLCTGRYTTESDGVIIEQGITVHKVHYDPEAEDHYILQNNDEPECFYIPDEVFESGESGFTYEYDTYYEPVWRYYLPDGYNIKESLYEGSTQLKKNDEPGAVYAYRQWTHYFEDDTEREEYAVTKLLYNEVFGCYVEDESFEEVEFYDPSYLEENGYEVVESYQQLKFVTRGAAYLEEMPAYTDNNGKTYYADYNNNVYSYSAADGIVIGDTTYYMGFYEPELSIGDLNDTEHDVVTDNYRYRIDGPEYHHVTGEPSDEKYTVSGKVTSFVTTEEEGSFYPTTVELLQGETVVKTYTEDSAHVFDYSFADVAAGDYTLRISKKNHVTRDYEVTVSADTTQDAKIHPIGDVSGDGKVSNIDYGRVNSHARQKSTLTDYAFLCGDVSNDGAIKNIDVGKINSMARQKSSLWT